MLCTEQLVRSQQSIGTPFVLEFFRAMKLYILIFSIFLQNGGIVANLADCSQKSNGEPGQCKPLTSCPELTDKLSVLNVASFLEQHSCGVEFETQNVLVCCPKKIPVFVTVTEPEERVSVKNNNVEKCGARQVGEGTAKWPFVVGIGDKYQLHCNGALITRDWVLTHAQCITQFIVTDVYLKIGLAKTNELFRIGISQRRRLPTYNSGLDLNGIAMVKLATPAVLSDDVQLACLPPEKGYDIPSSRYILYTGKFDDGSPHGGFEVSENWRNRKSLEQCRQSSTLTVVPTEDHLCVDSVHACNKTIPRPLLVGLNPDVGYTVLGVGGVLELDNACSSDSTVFTAVSSYLPFIYSIISPIQTNSFIETVKGFLNVLVGIPQLEVCGRRLVNQGSYFPFVAFLGRDSTEGVFSSHCTGVLVEKNWILTDTRCVQTNKIDFAQMGFKRQGGNTGKFAVASVHIPDYFKENEDHNTVALLKLAEQVNYSDDVQPVCLKHVFSNDTSPTLYALSGGYEFVEGKAISSIGLKTVGRVSSDNCLSSPSVPFTAPDHTHICTTSIEACKFIAHPPLVVEEDIISDSFTVVGVGGDSTDFCRGKYMGFVRVKNHWPWIIRTIYPGVPSEKLEVGVGKTSFVPYDMDNVKGVNLNTAFSHL